VIQLRGIGKYIAIVLFAIGALAVHSNGQEALRHWIYSGNFNLPFDATWNNVTLPAGQYSLAVDHTGYDGRVLLRRGTRAAGVLLPDRFSSEEAYSIQKAELVCVRHSGTLTIRALNLPNLGTFYYSLPKDLQAQSNPQLLEQVAISLSGK
jgi:hypothetical protein